ncbi:hypothetical protein SETIT_9G199400v2 [Setaria italica]|uniref:Uncharacterized protein n=1 Tax=Setaria italica TaxID=4555 RepID=A0A368SIN7_SETIT|nr:hypothetical protein SETIT_9G199400v2 [Setaria italica]
MYVCEGDGAIFIVRVFLPFLWEVWKLLENEMQRGWSSSIKIQRFQHRQSELMMENVTN